MHPHKSHAGGQVAQYHICDSCGKKFKMENIVKCHVTEVDRKIALLRTINHPIEFGYCNSCGGLPKTAEKIRQQYIKNTGLVGGNLMYFLYGVPYGHVHD